MTNGRILGILVLICVLVVACSASATATPTAAPTSTPTAALPQQSASTTQPTPTPAPQATSAPTKTTNARDKAIVVTAAEPASVGTWSEGCSGEIQSMGCQELTQDYIGWIDTKTLEPVLLSGFTKYQQIAPNRWRYTLREGVKFHNGEPWNAAAAKLGLDWNGVGSNSGNSLGYTGVTTGEVVDELTVDVVCENSCPIFPRTGIFTEFVAPQWWARASEEEKSTTTNGFGPYRIIDYNPGVDTQFGIYEGYISSDVYDAQAPTIQFITHTYRPEATVRAAMLIAGEADWAADIGFEEKQQVPQFRQSGTTEVYTLVLDVMWHRELSKQKVRQALAHAIDCEGLLDNLFHGEMECHAAIAAPSSVGITPGNSKLREYNPDLARQLLKEAGYDPANEINVNTRPGSNVKGPELMEAVVNHWREVGVTSNLNTWSDLGKAREIQVSGCGQFTEEPAYKEKLDCAQREPPGPLFASSHAYEIATSDETLDMQRQANFRMGCFGLTSRVCFPELQKKIETASATPAGPERARLMTEIADIAYKEVYFIPLFAVQMVYGLSNDVEWDPMYAPRFRGNTMHFKQ